MNWSKIGLICWALIYVSDISGQMETEDILWASVSFTKNISPKWSTQLKPIFRQNNDFATYQNTSIDLSVKRNLGKGWAAQVLVRKWFIPNGGTDRLFLWGDISYKTPLKSLSLALNQRVRYHLAFDTTPRPDLDYLRYIISLTPTTNWKVKPTIAYEQWFILNDVERYRHSRLQPGVIITIDEKTNISGTLWRQRERQVDGSTFFQNLWAINLGFKI